MKLSLVARILIACLLLLASGKLLSAQEPPSRDRAKHHKYRFIDLGTFGGPDSIIPFGQRILTKNGTVVGYADTSIPDPFAPNCGTPSCKVQNGFKWHDGRKIKLNGLYMDGASTAQGVNNRGIVVGDARTGLADPSSGAPQINAVLWTDAKLVELGTLGGNSSGAISISNGGHITGWSETTIPDPFSGSTETHAFLWESGVMHDLGTLGGPLSFGQDVNDHGQVVGFSFTDSIPNPVTGTPTQHPFFWENGHMQDLSLGGTDGDSGFVNNHGQSIGVSTLPGDIERHAFLWSEGELHDLGTLGGTRSRPIGLTENGHVAGASLTTNDETIHAVLWLDGKIRDLGTVPGDACSFAWGLNSKDQVVGISLPEPCDFSVARAFLWEDGSMVDLNTLIAPNSRLQLVYAEAINDAGEIVGIGVPPGISPVDVETLGHAFVLLPESDDCECQDEQATNNLAKRAASTNVKDAAAGIMRRFSEIRIGRNRRSLER
jgi:probable HAF family extracellular repeat protein